MNLAHRSYQKELLDHDTIPFEDIKKNMQELNFINEWLGGHSITLDGFKELAGNLKEITVCELGCGGGDNLLAIYNYCRSKNIKASFIGIDIKDECIDFAKSQKELSPVTQWITSDYKKVALSVKPHIIFSSLFCHHFKEDELTYQFNWMKENATKGFFVNDLHRNWLAYYSIKFLTQIFSSSYFVRNDAPLSVARGFTKHELEEICAKAKVSEAIVNWKWAFRYLVIYKKDTAVAI
jgi:2-polyprenyl-3-methyl-5-hydroxy-6-metoxy-1,4-benzoquinol methylase